MMYEHVIARRYAKGLMLSAKDNELDDLEEELKALVEALMKGSSDLYRLFEDPAFSPLERKAVIKRMKERFLMSDTLYHFLLLLIDKGRMMLLPMIHEALISLVDERRGRVRANIKSASPLDASLAQEIKDALFDICHKEVVATQSLHKELLGGIRVEVGGLIFDGTVQAKLDALKKQLRYEF